jgi:DNA-binding MurR/RpiR family transcriptional regulator
MAPLLKIRSERDQMSAIERRIADFLLENAHLLRDYSSQQLADALKISQSSVVKFSQKLGFKGYPDLKFSVGEAVARSTGGQETRAARPVKHDPHTALAQELWQSKARAEEETRLINTPERIAEIARAIDGAGKVFVIGCGEDDLHARAFSTRLTLLGVLSLHYVDPLLLAAGIATVAADDVVLVFCEHGRQAALTQLCRQFRDHGGKVISITRHTANPLRAQADLSLLVSAHDERSHIEPLLYQSALQHLLDLIYVLLCEEGADRLERLQASRVRIQHLLEGSG